MQINSLINEFLMITINNFFDDYHRIIEASRDTFVLNN
jgi:hypothetical protein